jgi:flagellar hook protein FlgE
MAFYTSISGLAGAQIELSTLANNIANVGTNGFKRSRVTFGDIIAASPTQATSRLIGQGTSVRSVSQQFRQGPIESSDSSLDLAISGQGFFTVKSGPGDSNVNFTRNGGFAVNVDRFVVDPAGRKLQLFPTTTDGSVISTDLSATISARLPLSAGLPQATNSIALSGRIPDRAIYTSTNPYVFNPADPATFNHSTSVTVFDSLGNPLDATIYYVKTGLPTPGDPTHRWTAHVLVGGEELQVGGTGGIPMIFDTSGVLTSPATPFAFDPFTPASGASAMALALDHGSATTQQSGSFGRRRVDQDGFPAGQLESVAVDDTGKLSASFSNGEILVLGKLALALFPNPQGLKQVGDASYAASPASGLPVISEAGRDGLGTILSGSIERSNVDLTVELVGLIAAQRNFQANAKAMETDTSLLQTMINMRN